MIWNKLRRKSAAKLSRSIAPLASSRRTTIEALENRQLMSMTVEIRTSTGASTASVTAVGQVIDLNIYVVIAGKESGSTDGVDSVTGSVLGTGTESGSVLGNLATHVGQDYTASSAQDGTSVDLNGDGGLDVGSNNNALIAGFFYPRAGQIIQDGTVSGDSMTLLVGTGTYTVTKLNSGDPTDVNFRVRTITGGSYEAVWQEDGVGVTDETASLLVGSPLVISGPTTATGSISGTVSKVVSGTTSTFSGQTVFLDTNNNGTLDSGEVSATTSSTGTYSFTGLAAGTYHVREVVPSGYTVTSPSSQPINVTLSSGQSATGDNFTDTAVVTATGSISGTVSKVVSGTTSTFSGQTVFLDTNNNGTLDSGETSTTTSSTGTYSFSGLAAGTYHVREVVPSGYTVTSPSSQPINVTLSSGQSATGENFTDTAAATGGSASISGYVFVDANGNGVWNSGEGVLSGVTVFLDTNKNGTLDSGEPTTTTNSGGYYIFSGLAAGTYKVQEVVPSNEKLTTAGSYTITLAATTASANKNFGNEATTAGKASIAGTISKVVSGVTSGDAGVTVYLDTNDNGTFDAGEPSAVTSSTGTYSFIGLAAGTYYIREVVPSGYTESSSTPAPIKVTLTASQAVTGENFTNNAVAAGTGSISGYVFDDTNGDGKWQSTEKAVAGVTIYIDSNNNGKLDSGEVSVVTNSSGEYTFSGLAAGSYVIREVVPSGKKLTTVGVYDVTISAGYNSTSKNFGNE